MTIFDQPATEGSPLPFPTPELPNDPPASEGQGPVELPTPSLPSTPNFPPLVEVRRCPFPYSRKITQTNTTFTNLLLDNNVSYASLKQANPRLSTGDISALTVYCAPPDGTRKLCQNGSGTYVVQQGETLFTLSDVSGLSVKSLLFSNPNLSPSDFVEGQVICLP